MLICELAAGSWRLAAGIWLLATGFWQLASGNWRLVAGFSGLAGRAISNRFLGNIFCFV